MLLLSCAYLHRSVLLSTDGVSMVRTASNGGTELWSCVGAGDGVCCPLYSDCGFRKRGGWCLSEQYEYLNLCYSRLARLEHDGTLSPADCNCINVGPTCQTLRLVEFPAENFIRRGGILCPPVPASLAMLADKPNNIEVRTVPLKFYRGGLWRLDGKWVVQLSSNEDPAARRFFLFHEIFHILAHHKTTPVFSRVDSEGKFFNEGLADHFALSVLAPPRWVKREWAKFKDISRMAAYFDVPYIVMFIALRLLSLV